MARPKGSKNKINEEKILDSKLNSQYDYVKNPNYKNNPPKATKVQDLDVELMRLSNSNNSLPQILESKAQRELRQHQQLIHNNIYALLKNIALTQFKWDGLPDTISEKMIEHGFLTRGSVVIFNDKQYGWLGLPSLPCFYNINGDKIYANTYGYGGYYKQVKILYDKEGKLEQLKDIVSDVFKSIKAEEKGVSVDDNNFSELSIPYLYINYVKQYTEILTNLKLGMLISAERLKQPFIVAIKKKGLEKATDKIINSIKNNEISVALINEQITGTTSVKDYIDFIDLKGDNEAPKKLQELYESQLNEFINIFGLNSNPSPDKTQYVNGGEVNSNNELLIKLNEIRLKNRQLLCKRCKDILGLDISVKTSVELDTREEGQDGILGETTSNTEQDIHGLHN